MAKANSTRKPVTKKSPTTSPKWAIDPSTLPEQYSLRVSGDCMEPGIKHGAVANFSTKEASGLAMSSASGSNRKLPSKWERHARLSDFGWQYRHRSKVFLTRITRKAT
jgi:hypothetical protein